MRPAVRVLVLTTLYPSSARPGHGIFVETRLRELLRAHGDEVQAKVVAPVPWFPSGHPRWGAYATMAQTPHREMLNGIDVVHPRYPVIPKAGMTITPLALAACALMAARRMRAEGFHFDVIDAHYFFPDGVAAAIVARILGKPLVITARGSDINLIAHYLLPRRMMRWAARQAVACIGVSQALVAAMQTLGFGDRRLHMLRNGVDLELFRPVPRVEARARIGQQGSPLLLSVGNLVSLKGHDLCIDAVAELSKELPGIRLLIVGTGPERIALQQQIARQGLSHAVTLVGAVAHTDLGAWYGAADCLILASSREGWPNVLLEAMACGTPVVATRVGGIPEMLVEGAVGRMTKLRDRVSLVAALNAVLASPIDRGAIRRHAEGFDWKPTINRLALLFQSSRTDGLDHA